MDEAHARVVETDDEPIRLPSLGRSFVIAVGLLALFGGATYWLLRAGAEPLPIAAFVFAACFVAPMVPAIAGEISLDRVVPFGGALAAVAIVYLGSCINLGSEGEFYPGRGSPQGGLLWLLTFAGVPVAAILGGAVGCLIAKRRRGRSDDEDDELLL